MDLIQMVASKLIKVEVQGFKSFQSCQDFSFDIDNGLYFVTGDNQVETDLGANGAGKSALFEAICWGLYGKTSTNLKASNVVNWGSKKCQVALQFSEFTVLRAQNPNALFINGDPVTQEELEKHLGGLGFESFLYSTFISQFSSKFFDLSPADKMVVFSDIMSETLKPWEDRSLQARVRAAQMDVTAKGMENTISKLQGNLEQLENTDYSKQIKEFEDSKKESLKKAKIRFGELVDNEKYLKIDLRKVMLERSKLQVSAKQFKSVISTGEYTKIKKDHETSKENYSAYKATYYALENDLEKMQGTIKTQTGICPVCKQMVSVKHLKAEIDSCKKQMAVAERDFNEYGMIVKKLGEKIFNFDKAIEKEKDKESEMKVHLRGLDLKVKTLTEKIEYAKVEIKRQEVNIEEIKAMKNNYLTLEKERQENLKKFKATIKDNEDLLGEAKKEYDAYTYWVGGFKSIRLLLLLDSLKELEISVNNNLNKLGLSDWSVKLDIDRETKSGTVRKGFSVLVCSPDNEDFVPMEVWSGGEMQRLKLAGSLGLMDLIQSKRQVDFGIEIFDEPTAWLSPVGISDLVQLLYDRAKENNKKLFLIDHKDLGSFGMFSGTINIVKDEKGSHIVGGL